MAACLADRDTKIAPSLMAARSGSRWETSVQRACAICSCSARTIAAATTSSYRPSTSTDGLMNSGFRRSIHGSSARLAACRDPLLSLSPAATVPIRLSCCQNYPRGRVPALQPKIACNALTMFTFMRLCAVTTCKSLQLWREGNRLASRLRLSY